MAIPETRYARAQDGSYIAYQVVGDGPTDVVYATGWMSNVDLIWEQPEIARFLRGIASFGRLIVMDRRGTGLSDRFTDPPTIETMMDDVRVTMDAAGSQRAVLIGLEMGGAMTSVFAATYPERTLGLVLIQCTARVAWSPDYPWGETDEFHREEVRQVADGWGTGAFERWFLERSGNPAATDEGYVARTAHYFRHSMSPGAAVLAGEIWYENDYRHVLPAIHVPTLVIEPHDDPARGAFLADRIAGAELAHMPDEAGIAWIPGSERVVERIARFISEIRAEEVALDRVLATVLFTDIVGSTARQAEMGDRRFQEVLREHDRLVNGMLARDRGRAIKTMGDGFLATFDGPARAIHCANAIVQAVERLGLEIRAGLHTGEIEIIGEDVQGLAVTIGARIGALAAPSEVLVSQTVKDLVAGSGLAFEDAGEHELKGVPDRWRLYRVGS